MSSWIHLVLLVIFIQVKHLHGFRGHVTTEGTCPPETQEHAAQIFVGCKHRCGGSIIGEKFILTAAQCVWQLRKLKEFFKDIMHVFVGDHVSTNHSNVYKIEKIVVHPKYNSKIASHADLALLKLREPIQFQDRVTPVELADQIPSDKQDSWLLRFETGTKGKYRREGLSLLDLQTCKNHFAAITKDMFCAKKEPNSGICYGDGGSPLFVDCVQVGVITGFSFCRDETRPVVFTSVPYYKDWIETTMKKIS